MALTLAQVTDVCLRGTGATQCRFLADDSQGKFYCIKKTSEKSGIDTEVAEFKKSHEELGIDPHSMAVPLGDNCGGFVYFKHKKQGYDVKP